MNPQVDEWLTTLPRWRNELEMLRSIVLATGLTETIKWGAPCYTHQQSNLVILGALKDYCVLSFFKGSLLQDPENILSKPGEHTQSARIVRFTNTDQITHLQPVLINYINAAIENEKAGLKVDFKDKNELILIEELQQYLTNNPKLKVAFEALTPGRQRGYNLYFAQPKQSATRVSRIEKCAQKISAGKGLNDY